MVKTVEPGDLNSQMIAFFANYLGIFMCSVQEVDQRRRHIGPAQTLTSSGFFIELGGDVYFATAGHTFDKFSQILNSSTHYMRSRMLAFHYGQHPQGDESFPFHLTERDHLVRHRSTLGLDYGLAKLSRLERIALEQNHIAVVTEEMALLQGSDPFDSTFMLGAPDEFTTNHLNAPGDRLAASVGITVLWLGETEQPNDVHSKNPWFYATLNSNAQIDNIEGMSGGPIFGSRTVDGQSRVWVIAMQSRWRKNDRLVFGCRLPVLVMDAIEQLKL